MGVGCTYPFSKSYADVASPLPVELSERLTPGLLSILRLAQIKVPISFLDCDEFLVNLEMNSF